MFETSKHDPYQKIGITKFNGNRKSTDFSKRFTVNINVNIIFLYG